MSGALLVDSTAPVINAGFEPTMNLLASASSLTVKIEYKAMKIYII